MTAHPTLDYSVCKRGEAAMSQTDAPEKSVYQIKVQGQLDEHWSAWLNGMTLIFEDEATILTGAIADQSALRGILTKLWDLNLELISVTQINRMETKK
jgi:hypothetical protein